MVSVMQRFLFFKRKWGVCTPNVPTTLFVLEVGGGGGGSGWNEFVEGSVRLTVDVTAECFFYLVLLGWNQRGVHVQTVHERSVAYSKMNMLKHSENYLFLLLSIRYTHTHMLLLALETSGRSSDNLFMIWTSLYDTKGHLANLRSNNNCFFFCGCDMFFFFTAAMFRLLVFPPNLCTSFHFFRGFLYPAFNWLRRVCCGQ